MKNNVLREFALENEITKMRLSAEYGARFAASGKLPPAMEKIWLVQLERFQKAYGNSRKIDLYEFIGSPAFSSAGRIGLADTRRELRRLLDILSDHGIAVDCLAAVEDREMYRFITEDLFREEVEDLHLPGLIRHYIYEEFYPNEKLNVQITLHEFFTCVEESNQNKIRLLLTATSKADRQFELKLSSLIQNLTKYRQIKVSEIACTEFKLSEFRCFCRLYTKIWIEEDQNPKKLLLPIHASFNLEKDNSGFWRISDFEFPVP